MLPVRDHLPTRITPWVNYALIVANIAAFALEANGVDLARWGARAGAAARGVRAAADLRTNEKVDYDPWERWLSASK